MDNKELQEKLEYLQNQYDELGKTLAELKELVNSQTKIEEVQEEVTIEETPKEEIVEEQLKPYFENDVELTQKNLQDYFKGYVGIKPINEVKNIDELAERVIAENRFGKFICVYDGFKIYNDQYKTASEIVAAYNKSKGIAVETVEPKKTDIESLFFTGGASLDEIKEELGEKPIEPIKPIEEKVEEVKKEEPKEEKKEEVKEEKKEEKKEKKEAPKYAPNSVGALVLEGKLPDISNKEFKAICTKLNIPFRNRTTIIPADKLDRLLNDNDIALANSKISLKSNIKEQSGMYSGLQKNYSKLQKDAEGEIWKESVKSDASKVDKERKEFESTVSRMQKNDILEELDLGTRTKNKVENLDKKKDNISEKLREQYKKLDLELEKQKKSKTDLKKFFSKKRQEMIEAKIERYSKKEAKVNSKQFEIVSTQTKKYIEKRKASISKHQKAQEKLQSKVEKANALREEIRFAEEQRKSYESDLKDAKGIERGALSVGREMMNQRIKSLQRKEAISNRRQQVSYSRKNKKFDIPTLDYSHEEGPRLAA